VAIPNAFTAAELELLRQVAAGARVVEAGALLGFSTVTIAEVAREVVSIDPHQGYPAAAPRSTWEQFSANLREYGVVDRVTAIRGSAEDWLPAMRADLAFFDLTGEYDVTAACLNRAPHVPRVAMHDYQRADCAGATRAVEEFISRRGRAVTRAGTLIVIDQVPIESEVSGCGAGPLG